MTIGRDTTVRSLDTTSGETTAVGGGPLSLGRVGGRGTTVVRTVSIEPDRVVLVADSILRSVDAETGQITRF